MERDRLDTAMIVAATVRKRLDAEEGFRILSEVSEVHWWPRADVIPTRTVFVGIAATPPKLQPTSVKLVADELGPLVATTLDRSALLKLKTLDWVPNEIATVSTILRLTPMAEKRSVTIEVSEVHLVTLQTVSDIRTLGEELKSPTKRERPESDKLRADVAGPLDGSGLAGLGALKLKNRVRESRIFIGARER